jgi:hypothetical membrane protein
MALGALAAAAYPGGTVLDRHAAGYSFFRNFISDLGMTVAHDGQSNWLGAALFVGSFGSLVVSLATCAAGFVSLHAPSPRSRSFARLGAVGGALIAVCLLGAALAPVNEAAPIHMWFAAVASVIAPPTLVIFAIAAARDDRMPVQVAVAWLMLAIAIGTWFAMRWGPSLATPAGLTIQATVQKAVAAVVVCVGTFQTFQGTAVAEAFVASSPARSSPSSSGAPSI